MATPNLIRCQEKEKLLSIEYLRSILNYNPETGEFRWKERDNIPKHINKRKMGHIAGIAINTGHRRIKINGKNYWAHRLAWFYMTGNWPKEQIDHKNLNSSDNKWENLREATHGQNNQNKKIPINCKTGIKGVRLVIKGNCKRYKVRISINGKDVHLGYYQTLSEAAQVRKKAATKYFGEFAKFE